MHKAQGAVQRCVLCHIPCPVAQLPPVTLLGNDCTATASTDGRFLAVQGLGGPRLPERGNHGPWTEMPYRVVVTGLNSRSTAANSVRELGKATYWILFVFIFQVVCATTIAYTVSCVYTQHSAWANLGCLPQTSRKRGLAYDERSRVVCLT